MALHAETHRIMTTHFQYNDQELEQMFEDEQLPPALFSHEAHLRLAFIHIRKYGLEKAIRHLTEQIWLYAEGLGVHDKYNETVTVAAVKAVGHFIKKMEGETFHDLMTEFPRLKDDFKGLIRSHYSVDIFNSDAARQKFLEPDLLPFD